MHPDSNGTTAKTGLKVPLSSHGHKVTRHLQISQLCSSDLLISARAQLSFSLAFERSRKSVASETRIQGVSDCICQSIGLKHTVKQNNSGASGQTLLLGNCSHFFLMFVMDSGLSGRKQSKTTLDSDPRQKHCSAAFGPIGEST